MTAREQATCATCDLMDDALPCEYHRGWRDGAEAGWDEGVDYCEDIAGVGYNTPGSPIDANPYRAALSAHIAAVVAERDELAEKVARVEALARAAKRDEATSLSRTFDGGTFGAWVSADQILAALTGADQ